MGKVVNCFAVTISSEKTEKNAVGATALPKTNTSQLAANYWCSLNTQKLPP